MNRKIIQLLKKNTPFYDNCGERRRDEEVTYALCNDGTWWLLGSFRDDEGYWHWAWEEQTRIPQNPKETP